VSAELADLGARDGCLIVGWYRDVYTGSFLCKGQNLRAAAVCPAFPLTSPSLFTQPLIASFKDKEGIVCFATAILYQLGHGANSGISQCP
jgi:hypothetical protein